MKLIRYGLLAGITLTLLSACSDSSWNGKDVSWMWPPLEFELTSETGQPVTEELFAGQVVAIYFGFTHCPDICPTTLAKLSAAVRQLPEAMAEGVQTAFVSIDPDRDTPERLAVYTNAFDQRMLGLTGTQEQLTALTRRYRISYGYEQPGADGSYDVSHSSSIVIFDTRGDARLMMLDTLDVASIAADLERLLREEA